MVFMFKYFFYGKTDFFAICFSFFLNFESFWHGKNTHENLKIATLRSITT